MGVAMSDALFFVMAGVIAAGAIALALVWPQGLGSASPAPFGHAVTPELGAPLNPPQPPRPKPPPSIAGDDQLKGAL
jgi:hypothetical protein